MGWTGYLKHKSSTNCNLMKIKWKLNIITFMKDLLHRCCIRFRKVELITESIHPSLLADLDTCKQNCGYSDFNAVYSCN